MNAERAQALAREEDAVKSVDDSHFTGSRQLWRSISSLALPVVLVIASGCASGVPAEWLLSRDKGCSHLLLLADYVYNLVATAPGVLRARRERGGWALPLRWHVALAASNFGYNALLNAAMNSPLPMSVVVVLKNGGLVANLVVGCLLLGKRYSFWQVLAVLVVTSGLVATALGGRRSKADSGAEVQLRAEATVGIAIMVAALFVRALWGALQERIMQRGDCKKGELVAESMFFRAALGLPLLALQGGGQVAVHWRRWNEGSLGGLPWPGAWGLLMLKLCLDYVFRTASYRLVGRTSALSTAVTLTVQRFVSFALSALVLNPVPGGAGAALWGGSLAVLAGAVAYATAPQPDQLEMKAGSEYAR